MKHRGGHHGGAWKVAYADFITAMMALFLVLWLTAQDTKIKEAVERAFRNPFSAVNKESTGIIPNSNKDATAQSSASQSKGNFDSANAVEMEMLRHITEDLSKMLQDTDEAQQSVQLELTPEGLRINVFYRSRKPVSNRTATSSPPFPAGSPRRSPGKSRAIKNFKIELEGHTEAPAPRAAREGKQQLGAFFPNARERRPAQAGPKRRAHGPRCSRFPASRTRSP